jgi:predicted transcriptional regulator
MKELTRAEEEIMQILWQLNNAKVSEIIDQMQHKKPSYNTVSTIVRILQDKGFVGFEKEGRGYRYFPIVNKEAYQASRMNTYVDNYFDGSFKNMLSFFVKKKEVNVDDLEAILKQINPKDDA